MLIEIAVMLFLILVNGFFALAEMAVISSRKARLRHEAEQGRKAYGIVLETAENPSHFLSTIQIVITLVSTLTGAVGGATVALGLEAILERVPSLVSIAQPLSLGIVVVLTTFVSVILGELVPKNLALSRPEAIAAAVIRPLRGFAFVFSPLARFLSGVTELVIRLFGIRGPAEPSVTEEEVKVLIAQGAEAGVFEDREREMVEGALSLGDKRVTSLMTPRTEVVLINTEDGPDAAREVILENARYAYLPVVEGDLDKVIGLLPVNDALAAIVRGTFGDPRAMMAKPVMIPETTTALKAFAALKAGEVKTGLILDEYGGVAGLVTLADIMAAVVGDIPQTGDEDEPEMLRREDGSWLVDGSLAVESFLETLGHDDQSDERGYETVAGLVLNVIGIIPRAGDRYRWRDCIIEIVDMDGNRIDKVIVHPRPTMLDPTDSNALA
jgi:putative hemolysin